MLIKSNKETVMTTLKTATEIKEWMDNKLHESGKFEKYEFKLPFKVIPKDEGDPNWTLNDFSTPIIGNNIDPNDEEYLRAIDWAFNIFLEALISFTLVDGH